MKREEVDRFLRAKEDKKFAEMIKVRTLGPEHTENQLKLRKSIQASRSMNRMLSINLWADTT
jgi:nucleoporin NUP159